MDVRKKCDRRRVRRGRKKGLTNSGKLHRLYKGTEFSVQIEEKAMKERVVPAGISERICHRLKADLRRAGMKCIPELAGRRLKQ